MLTSIPTSQLVFNAHPPIGPKILKYNSLSRRRSIKRIEELLIYLIFMRVRTYMHALATGCAICPKPQLIG